MFMMIRGFVIRFFLVLWKAGIIKGKLKKIPIAAYHSSRTHGTGESQYFQQGRIMPIGTIWGIIHYPFIFSNAACISSGPALAMVSLKPYVIVVLPAFKFVKTVSMKPLTGGA